MSATTIIIHALLADAGVASEVSTRIWPLKAPQDAALPYLIVSLVDEDEDQILAGAGGVYEARVAVASHAASYSAADSLAETVKAALGDLTEHTVTDGDSPAATLGVLTSWKAGGEVSDVSDDATVFRRVVDFMARWR